MPFSPGGLTPMAKTLLAENSLTNNAGTPLGDSAAILHFLDRYFENPDCDRTQKEFGSRPFESTLAELEEKEASANEWTIARWRYFVEKGPSLTALSACSKASAKANKSARMLSQEAPSDTA